MPHDVVVLEVTSTWDKAAHDDSTCAFVRALELTAMFASSARAADAPHSIL